MNHTASLPSISACIIAGGQSRRMGGRDKGLLPFAGRPMVASIIERLKPQVDAVFINSANPDYRQFGLEQVADAVPGGLGPLAGFLTACRHAATERVVVVPCDAPLLPHDLVARLAEALKPDIEVAIARADDGLHPAFALLRRRVAGDIASYLDDGGRALQGWLKRMAHATVAFDRRALSNINTPEELADAERYAR